MLANIRGFKRVVAYSRLIISTLVLCAFHSLWWNHLTLSLTTMPDSYSLTFLTLNSSRACFAETFVGDNFTNGFVPWHPNITDRIWGEKDLHLLEKFDPLVSPIIKNAQNSGQPVRIRILLFKNKDKAIRFRKGPNWAISDEVLNICMDGFQRSPYFDLVNTTIVEDFSLDPDFVLQEKGDIVWVVDMRRVIYHQKSTHSIGEQTLRLAKGTLEYQNEEFSEDEKGPSLRVVFVDYRDIVLSSLGTKVMTELTALVGEDNVHTVIRQVVKRRRWSDDINWIRPGHIGIPGLVEANYSNMVRAPYPVRSDIVEAVKRIYPRFLPQNNPCDSPVFTIRTVDAAHFWTINRREGYSHLRNAVTEVVLSLNGTVLEGRKIRTVGSIVSEKGPVGRTSVAERYVEGLLTAKIVVVAQRDRYEDHYRLFEAFSGGAMVMTDTMLSLPQGLVDGESVVMYRSREHLRDLLLYYLHPNQNRRRLEIARRGFAIAMGQHRSFHLMERLFFGMNHTVG